MLCRCTPRAHLPALAGSFLAKALIVGTLAIGTLLAIEAPVRADTAAGKIGSVGAIDTAALGQVPGSASRPLLIGADIFLNQTIRTDATGLVDIMFLDESTLTIGHGSELVLDAYNYDPDAERGNLAVSLWDGAMRFIGGKISKKTPVRVVTPLASMTIRGGIGMFSFPRGQDGLVAFIYGVEITVTGHSGVTRSIRQPGYGVSVPANGGDPSEPFRLTDAQISALRSALESNSTDQGQAVPTEPLAPIRDFGSKDPKSPDKSPNDNSLMDIFTKGSGGGGNMGSGS